MITSGLAYWKIDWQLVAVFRLLVLILEQCAHIITFKQHTFHLKLMERFIKKFIYSHTVENYEDVKQGNVGVQKCTYLKRKTHFVKANWERYYLEYEYCKH